MRIATMPTFQIREMPEDLYQRIAANARREHRSLAQQAVIELRRAQGGADGSARRAMVAHLRAEDRRLPATAAPPEDLIREDRDAR
jgi:hypothetical protein